MKLSFEMCEIYFHNLDFSIIFAFCQHFRRLFYKKSKIFLKLAAKNGFLHFFEAFQNENNFHFLKKTLSKTEKIDNFTF